MAERSWGKMSFSSKLKASSLRVEFWGCNISDSAKLRSKSSKEWHIVMDLRVACLAPTECPLLQERPPQAVQQDIDLEEYVVVEAKTFDFFVFLTSLGL